MISHDIHSIRSRFIDFYLERDHRLIGGTSLIPPDPDDPVLLVTSGMHPLTRYLEGTPHPLGGRLVGTQRCFRTTDLDEVGDQTHLTLFEMLGSWSLGDYSHDQSLRWGYELLVDGFGISTDLIGVSVFGGSSECPPDEDSVDVWRDLGIPDERITRLVEDNWWSNGEVGLCGPDSEIFIWTMSGEPTGRPGVDDGWVEVWNHVSMPFWRDTGGRLRPLPRRCVDTGMGFERLVTILEGVPSVWESSVWRPWTEPVGKLWGLEGPDLHLVCDHLRSGITLIGDGVVPGNGGRGYVLRRILRRTMRTVRSSGDGSVTQLPIELIENTVEWFGPPRSDRSRIQSVLSDEEQRYRSTLERGRQEVNRLLRRGGLSEDRLDWLWETHGLPREVVHEVVSELPR